MAIRCLLKNAHRTALIGAVQLAIVVGASAVTAHADTSPLTTWCNLNLGQGKAEVLAAMGTPNGSQADSVAQLWTEMSPSSTSAEWDTSGAILLAGFDNGNTVHLMAYDAKYGGASPIGAPGITCEPFRNQNS
ncbi:MAG: hypothetical protein JWN03_2660 [Nocardia sp.]|uniref:hypothetical protein n=1 Tax=Nocardia sp. TaxID=1821 RepID=UPI0026202F59|nr:hypothetical protein [Nocardia sp.]MCU1642385.1 hypothetical protein [Nocardia sp.]